MNAICVTAFNLVPFCTSRVGLFLSTIALLGLSLVGTTHAQCGDFENYMRNIGSAYLPQNGIDIAISGSYAYIAGYYNDLQVVDISNPESPQLVANLSIAGVNAIAVAGDYIYMAAGNNGFQVMDISDPTNPLFVVNVAAPDYIKDVTISGGYAYVAAQESGFHIFDLTNPTSPVLVNTVNTPGNTVRVDVSGGYAFVINWWGNMSVLDLADPVNPQQVGNENLPSLTSDVFVAVDLAYVVSGTRLDVIDVSNPANPQIRSSMTLARTINGRIVVSGNLAYITSPWDHGLLVVDISDPYNPQTVGGAFTSGPASAVALTAGYTFILADSRLQVLVPSNPLTVIGGIDTPGDAGECTIQGDYAYVADQAAGLQVINIANPAFPMHVGTFDIGGNARAVTVSGGIAWVADWYSGLVAVDVSDPTTPKLIGSVGTPDLAEGVVVAGDYAYVADRDNGLQIVGISDPANPQLMGSVPDAPSEYWAMDLALSGSHAFIVGFGSLHVVDISDPANPQLVGELVEIGSPSDIVIVGDLAYLSSDSLLVIDISDPPSPQVVGGADRPGSATTPSVALGVAVSGNIVCLADYSAGMHAFDITDPVNPQLLFSLETPGWAFDVEISGGYAFVADLSAGLQVLPINCEADIGPDCNGNGIADKVDVMNDPSLDQNNDGFIDICQPNHGISDVPQGDPLYVLHNPYPNPFNPQTTIAFNLPEPTRVSLRIHDLSGRLVRSLLADAMVGQGRSEFVWHGRDESGRKVSSGVYFLRLDAGNFKETKRLIMIK